MLSGEMDCRNKRLKLDPDIVKEEPQQEEEGEKQDGTYSFEEVLVETREGNSELLPEDSFIKTEIKEEQVESEQVMEEIDKNEHEMSDGDPLKCNKPTKTVRDFMCTICNYGTKRPIDFTRHWLSHEEKSYTHENGVFKCQISDCSYVAPNEEDLLKHVASQHLYRYRCDFCYYVTFSEKDYEQHRTTHYTYQCVKCNLQSTKHFFVQNHVQKPFKCDICDFASFHWFPYKKHISWHEYPPDSIVACGFCDFTTGDQALLEKHKAVHCTKFMSCKICRFTGLNTAELAEHWENVHDTTLEAVDKLHKCKFCTCKFIGLDYKEKHEELHLKSGASLKCCSDSTAVQCPYCDHQDNRRYDLNLHISSKHAAELELDGFRYDEIAPIGIVLKNLEDCDIRDIDKCSEGDQVKHEADQEASSEDLPNYEEITVVIDDIAEDQGNEGLEGTTAKFSKSNKPTKTVRDFMCTICNYATKRPIDFTRHWLSHEEKSYTHENGVFKCQISDCSYVAPNEEDLLKHVASQHLYRYRCDFCYYVTFSEKDYEQHRTTHYTYQCVKCNLQSTKYFFVQIHLKTPFKCEICDFASFHWFPYKKHISWHEYPPDSIVACGFCDFTTGDQALLEKHKAVHCTKFMSCKICRFTGLNTAELAEHWENVHDTTLEAVDKLHKCKFCTCKFIGLDYKEKHEELHLKSGASLKCCSDSSAVQCPYCDHQDNRRYDMNLHIISKHAAEFELDGFRYDEIAPIGTVLKNLEDCDIRDIDKCSEGDQAKHEADQEASSEDTPNYEEEITVVIDDTAEDQGNEDLEGSNANKTRQTVWRCPMCPHLSQNKLGITRHLTTKHKMSYMEAKRNEDLGGSNANKTKSKYTTAKFSKSNKPTTTVRDFMCTICNYATKRPIDFTRHWLSHEEKSYTHENGVFKCQISDCSYVVPNEEDLLKHVASQHLYIYRCDFCYYVTFSEKDYEQHRTTHYTYQCVKCNLQSTKHFFVQKHVKTPFKCERCDFASFHWFPYKKHISWHEYPPDSIVACGFCDFTTGDQALLEKHKAVHCTKFMSCKICRFTGLNTAELAEHWENVHDTTLEAVDKLQKCKFCTCKFLGLDYKENHEELHLKSGASLKCCSDSTAVQCPYCDHQDNRRYDMNLHISSKHAAELELDGFRYNEIAPIGVVLNNLEDCDIRDIDKSSEGDQAKHEADQEASSEDTPNYEEEITVVIDDTAEDQGNEDLEGSNANKTRQTVWRCPMCPHLSQNKLGITRHLTTKHKMSYRIAKRNEDLGGSDANKNRHTFLRCPMCPHLSKTTLDITRHLTTKHKMSYIEAEEIEDLGRSHANKTRQILWRCPMCPHLSKNKLGITHHLTTKHKMSYIEAEGNEDLGGRYANKTRQILWRCPMCLHLSKNKLGISRHLIDVHKIIESEAESIIRYCMPTEQELKTDAPRYICSFCYYVTSSKEDYDFHCNKHTTFKCNKCSFESTKRLFVEDHIENPWGCSKCKFKTHHWLPMKSHSFCHNKQTSTLLKCKKCDFETRSSGVLKTHWLTHEAELLRCKVCLYKTKYNSLLRAHYTEWHDGILLDDASLSSDDRPYECDLCACKFKQQLFLDKHRKLHGENGPFRLKCTQCYQTKKCKTSENVDNSKGADMHNSWSKCPYCRYEDGVRYRMIEHLSEIHQEELESEGYRFDDCQTEEIVPHTVTSIENPPAKMTSSTEVSQKQRVLRTTSTDNAAEDQRNKNAEFGMKIKENTVYSASNPKLSNNVDDSSTGTQQKSSRTYLTHCSVCNFISDQRHMYANHVTAETEVNACSQITDREQPKKVWNDDEEETEPECGHHNSMKEAQLKERNDDVMIKQEEETQSEYDAYQHNSMGGEKDLDSIHRPIEQILIKCEEESLKDFTSEDNTGCSNSESVQYDQDKSQIVQKPGTTSKLVPIYDKSEYRWCCPVCRYTALSSKHFVEKHIDQVHSGGQNMSWPKVSSKEMHSAEQSSKVASEEIPCKQPGCHFKASTVDELSMHMARHLQTSMQEVMVYKCEVCGFGTVSNTIFRDHKKFCNVDPRHRYRYTRMKGNVCNKCGNSSKDPSWKEHHHMYCGIRGSEY